MLALRRVLLYFNYTMPRGRMERNLQESSGKIRITLQKAPGTVVWHRAGGFALVQALLPDRLFIINGIVIANRVFGGNIGGFGGSFLLGFQRCLVIGKGVQGVQNPI